MIIMINKNSGGGTSLEKWKRIYKQLGLNGSSESFVIGVNGSTDKFILDSVKKGKTEFVIAGGDGSINYFLNRCIELLKPYELKQIKIGAIGIGSSNDFHKPFDQQNILNSIPYRLNFKEAIIRDVGCIQYEKDGNFFLSFTNYYTNLVYPEKANT